FFSSRRRHTRWPRDWSSDVCSSDLHVIEGHLTTGDMVVFFAYVTNLYSPMKALARLSYVTSKASVGAERIADIMRVRSEVTDHRSEERRVGKECRSRWWE